MRRGDRAAGRAATGSVHTGFLAFTVDQKRSARHLPEGSGQMGEEEAGMKQDRVPLVRRFSALAPYQQAYTLVCSLEPETRGCWLSICRSAAPGSPEARARVWIPAPEEEGWRMLRYLWENAVQPELWQDVIACWYPQTAEVQCQQEGGAAGEQ